MTLGKNKKKKRVKYAREYGGKWLWMSFLTMRPDNIPEWELGENRNPALQRSSILETLQFKTPPSKLLILDLTK